MHEEFKIINDLEKIFGFKIPKDGILMALTKKPQIDIFKIDDLFQKYDPDYNNIECTYKEKKNVSMNDYIVLKWGEEVKNKFEILC